VSNLESNHEKKGLPMPQGSQFALPGIVFKNGFFVTDQPEEQYRIESDPLYGEKVFSYLVNP
jgi:hypothetical protein